VATYTTLPSSVGQVTAGGALVWSNPGNAALDDGSYASITFATSGLLAQHLSATFPILIPSKSTIQGIAFTVEGRASGADMRDSDCEFGSAVYTKFLTATWANPGNWETHTIGSSSDNWGLSTWTTGNIVFRWRPRLNSGGPVTLDVDHISLTITYTPPVLAPAQLTPGSPQLFAPSLTPGAVDLELPLTSPSPPQLFALNIFPRLHLPLISPSSPNVLEPDLTWTPILYLPTIAPSSPQLYAPTLAPGAVTLELPLTSPSSPQLYSPAIDTLTSWERELLIPEDLRPQTGEIDVLLPVSFGVSEHYSGNLLFVDHDGRKLPFKLISDAGHLVRALVRVRVTSDSRLIAHYS